MFEDVTERAGLAYLSRSWGSAWGDFNNDGFPDLYVGNHASGPSLFLNNGDGTFSDVTEKTIAQVEGDLHGAAWADFDNDGDQDLIIVAGGASGRGSRGERTSNKLLLNENGAFDDVAAVFGVDDGAGRGRTPLWHDFDSDGMLDLVLTQWVEAGQSGFVFRNAGTRFERCDDVFGGPFEKRRRHVFGQVTRLGNSDAPVLVLYESRLPAMSYGHFDVCRFGFAEKLAAPIVAGIRDAVIADFDGDLRNDIVVATGRRQEGIGVGANAFEISSWVETGQSIAIEFSSESPIVLKFDSAMIENFDDFRIGSSGSAIQMASDHRTTLRPEPDTIGFPSKQREVSEVRVGYLTTEERWRLEVSPGGATVDRKGVAFAATSESNIAVLATEGMGDKSDQSSNQLLLSVAIGLEVSDRSLAAATDRHCSSVAAADFDNDMDLDTYFVCAGRLGNAPNQFFVNMGEGVFHENAQRSNTTGSMDGIGESVSVADFDGDGFLDLFVANGHGRSLFSDGPNQLLRNRATTNAWTKLRLIGTQSNRDGYGARVFGTTGDVTQVRDHGTMRRGGQDHQVVHFGLGQDEGLDEVIVEWPSGTIERFVDLAARKTHVLNEGDGEPVWLAAVVGRKELSVGSAVPFTGLMGPTIDPDSLRWRVGEESLCEGKPVCWFTPEQSGHLDIVFSGQDAAGEATTATLGVTVRPE